MASPLVNKAHKYARDVISGKIDACIQVKQACKRQIDDLKKERQTSYPYRFDRQKAEIFLQFCETMPHVKGKWAGSDIVLEPWQCFTWGVPFGWVRKKDGLRRYREIFLLVPRKNTKSTLGAIVGNYMFSIDGEKASEVYSVANTQDQSFEIFRPAWQMAMKNPEYKEFFAIDHMGTVKNPGNMYSIRSDSRFEAVVGNRDGASPHCWLQDEYHEARDSTAYDTGKTGMGARSHPMMVVVTTAGTNTSGPCYDLQKQVEKVLSGELENDELWGVIYTIDPDDDWTNFDVWEKANPNIGVSVSVDFLRGQHRTALQNPRKQNIIRCKHLNQWSNAGSSWLNMVEWGLCSDSNLNIEDFEGETVFIGLDLASKIDVAAKIYIFKRDDIYYVFSKFYIPLDRTHGENMTHYAGWAHEGYLETTVGSRIDLEYIQQCIIDDSKLYDISGTENGGGEVCNDPWNAQQLVTNLLEQGIGCVEVPQMVNHLSEPMKEIEALVKAGKLKHDNNPVMNWMVGNVVCKTDKKDNVFPYKEGDENKIDGAVALISGFNRAMHHVSETYTGELMFA